MKKIKYLVLTLGVIFGVGLAFVPADAGALNLLDPVCDGGAKDTVLCKDRKEEKNSFDHIVGILVNTLLFLVAAVSVIMIIIAGIYYTTSNGDAALVKKAKDTLLYSIVGLIVAILAYAIVNYVISAF